MVKRRDMLKMGASGAVIGLLTPMRSEAELLFPDGAVPSHIAQPSHRVPLSLLH